MFKPVTPELAAFQKAYPGRITKLEEFFDGPSGVYIDYANVRKRLGWRIDLERLKQLFDSFGVIVSQRFYFGTLEGDKGSEGFIRRIQKIGFELCTKPVKIMNLSIDATSITKGSPDILEHFISETLLRSLKLDAIEYLNEQLRDLNKQGVLALDHRKCNFDVEIGTDMRMDNHLGKCNNFCLWSGDSDFADPLRCLLGDMKKVIIFGAGGRIASELSDLRSQGLEIFDIKKLREVIEDKKRG
jgi:uncharacterized LabA/DUF88 family protein